MTMRPAVRICATTTGADLSQDVHQRIGALTRQLHDSLNGLGLTEKVKSWAKCPMRAAACRTLLG
jgi:chemotaxis regulatin CheY-phosphate phosphatase CheZ